ncbi:iron donor protein CyaY [Neoehrlichia mikurensis]|uniref:Iron donor protein CyaY n=1 Tax=Neoehrlichia mikurensis TaxID=89586 RepID=A0A9Q9F416_9RICK|nr:frataxin domain-containing protein [Neoehrlichia mikurensis]QXK91722.1 iron donor protein CyaY [Neoehrlichia mikurensis]QXK92934.1 iron donor protein CyaY [Neoehrlichia mikurensis]QXK93412.1 iron donor protein CyaY [Neoehrlichia mikurensis]UTO55637.1 iron donor protein CyaY [Neoehrlichia mikurensis]UTO56558.1 iron donor protein CyaY [Neoehrlichia mikurensis]
MVESLSIFQFQSLAYEVLNSLLYLIEDSDLDGVLECDSYEGLVKITNGKDEYVISKHDSSMQIWISSPLSGSVRFSYDSNLKVWYNSDNCDVFEFVKKEISLLFNINCIS